MYFSNNACKWQSFLKLYDSFFQHFTFSWLLHYPNFLSTENLYFIISYLKLCFTINVNNYISRSKIRVLIQFILNMFMYFIYLINLEYQPTFKSFLMSSLLMYPNHLHHVSLSCFHLSSLQLTWLIWLLFKRNIKVRIPYCSSNWNELIIPKIHLLQLWKS